MVKIQMIGNSPLIYPQRANKANGQKARANLAGYKRMGVIEKRMLLRHDMGMGR